MALFDFLGGLFGGGEQQQYNPPSTQDVINQTYGALNASVPGVLAYNQALAPGLTGIQLGVEKQFDPNVANLRAATSQSILDQLNLGTALPADLQQQVIQNALEGSAASGFGVGQGGRGLVARDLGLTGLDLLNQRQGTAAGYVRSSPSLSSLYQPQGFLDPTTIASDIRNRESAMQQYANAQEAERQAGFANLLKTGLTIAGTVAGGFFGSAAGPLGTIGGATVGAGLGNAVGGFLGGSNSGGGMSGFNPGSILNFGGNQGPLQYPGPNNEVMTSVPAQPYNGFGN